MIQSGAVQILLPGIADIPRMRELMRKYRDLPMDLVDAGVVRVAERERLRRIFTLDRRDFHVYRPSRIGRFTILPPRIQTSIGFILNTIPCFPGRWQSVRKSRLAIDLTGGASCPRPER